MYVAAGAKAFGPQPVILSLFSRPKPKIENDVRSQFQRSAGNTPKQILDGTVSGIVFCFVRILTEETNLPLVRCQTKC